MFVMTFLVFSLLVDISIPSRKESWILILSREVKQLVLVYEQNFTLVIPS